MTRICQKGMFLREFKLLPRLGGKKTNLNYYKLKRNEINPYLGKIYAKVNI